MSATCTSILSGHRDEIWSVKWSPQNEFLLATGSCDETIRLWDIRKASPCLCIFDRLNTELANPDKKRKRAFSKEDDIRSHTASITSICFSPDGLLLLSTGFDNKVRCWDVMSGKNTMINYPGVKNLTTKGNQMTVSRNGRYLYHPQGKSIHVFDILSGERKAILKGHFGTVNCCIFHPSYVEMYSGSNDNKILVWTPGIKLDSVKDLVDDKDNWSD